MATRAHIQHSIHIEQALSDFLIVGFLRFFRRFLYVGDIITPITYFVNR